LGGTGGREGRERREKREMTRGHKGYRGGRITTIRLKTSGTGIRTMVVEEDDSEAVGMIKTVKAAKAVKSVKSVAWITGTTVSCGRTLTARPLTGRTRTCILIVLGIASRTQCPCLVPQMGRRITRLHHPQ
jgi:hypothetical protein